MLTQTSTSGGEVPRLPPRVVVIVTHNSERDIERCLLNFGGEQLVVVDNASTDVTLDILTKRAVGATIIANDRNVGFATAANQGIAACRRSDVVLVNPDVALTPTALDRLAVVAADERVGIVAPKLRYPDGSAQESARTFPTIWKLLGRHTPFGRTVAGTRWASSYLEGTPCRDGNAAVDWVIGAAMYLSRRALDVTGGFDEAFFLYGEDVDLCARTWLSGYTVVVASEAEAVHQYRRASRQVADVRRAETRHHWVSMFRLGLRYPAQFVLAKPLRRASRIRQ